MAEGDLPHRFQLAGDRPQGHHRPHPLRHLQRGDALLPERHLFARRQARAAPQCCAAWRPTAIAWPGSRCRCPKGADEIPGVIVPRKTVGEVRKLLDESDGSVEIELSDTRIRFAFGDVTLTSQADRRHLPGLRARHPDRQRQDPERAVQGVRRRRRPRLDHLDREVARRQARGRQGRGHALGDQPRRRQRHRGARGRATTAAPLEIGFNSRYLLDITEQIAGDEARFLMADAGSPTWCATAPTRARSTCSCRCGYDGAADQRSRLYSRRRIRRSAGRSWPCASFGSPTSATIASSASTAASARSCWSAPTAPARPTCWRRCRSWRPAAACAARASTRSAAAARTGEPDAAAWAVAATLDTPDGRRRHRHRPGAGPRAKAACRAGWCGSTAGRPQSQTALGLHVAAVWLTPQLDRLFLDGAGERRRFLDRLVTALHPEHAGDVAAYENALRERTRLLGEGSRDPHWFAALEDTMARHGVALAAARRRHRPAPRRGGAAGRRPLPARRARHGGRDRRLARHHGRRSTPRTGCAPSWPPAAARCRGRHHIRGAASQRPRGAPSRSRPAGRRGLDRRAEGAPGRRSCWPMPGWWRCRAAGAPLLLLDEIAAHLDAERRAALFDEVVALGAQSWMTGTDAELFAPLARPRAVPARGRRLDRGGLTLSESQDT